MLNLTMPQEDKIFDSYFTVRLMGGFLDSAGGSSFLGPLNSGTPARRSKDPHDPDLSYCGALYPTAVLSTHDGQSGVGLLELVETASPPPGFSNFSGRAYLKQAPRRYRLRVGACLNKKSAHPPFHSQPRSPP